MKLGSYKGKRAIELMTLEAQEHTSASGDITCDKGITTGDIGDVCGCWLVFVVTAV